MENLLLPFLWLFMLLEWVYKKILHFIYWIMGEPETQRKRKDILPERRPDATEPQRKTIEQPDREPPKDDGMNPQERTLPYITPEPVKEQEPKKKKELPPVIFEFPRRGKSLKVKSNGREQQDRGRE